MTAGPALLITADTLSVWIPGAPASPNRRGRTTRARMARTTAERERAQLVTLAARNAAGWLPVTGPARITFTVHRRRLLDPLANLPASLKATQDGVCRALLPLGDGPGTPYVWAPPEQVQVGTAALEGVRVTITRLEEARPA